MYKFGATASVLFAIAEFILLILCSKAEYTTDFGKLNIVCNVVYLFVSFIAYEYCAKEEVSDRFTKPIIYVILPCCMFLTVFTYAQFLYTHLTPLYIMTLIVIHILFALTVIMLICLFYNLLYYIANFIYLLVKPKKEKEIKESNNKNVKKVKKVKEVIEEQIVIKIETLN
jgi:hypothetical protein